MNIQTSRAIYDMPIISPQHAHWRAVRKLFDKKSASGASPISTHFQFEWRHGGERRRPRSMKAGAATSDLGCEYNPFLLFQTQLRLRSTCKAIDQLFSPPVLTFYNFQANSAPLAVRLLGNYLKYLNCYLPTTTEDLYCVAETLTPAGAMCYMCG